MMRPQHTAEGMHRGTVLVWLRLGTDSVRASEAVAVATAVTDGVRMLEGEAVA